MRATTHASLTPSGPTMRLRLLLTLAATASAVGASAAAAQLPTLAATGSQVVDGRDLNWDVKCSVIVGSSAPTPSMDGSTTCNDTYFAAYAVTSLAGGWGPVAPNTNWISVRPNATLGRNSDWDENALYRYTFRTTFDVAPSVNPQTLRLDLDRLRIDNYWLGYRLNGGALVASGVSPTPLPPNGANWATPFAVRGLHKGSGAIVQGENTLELIVTGNGRTDGILATGTLTSTVPEPGTYALLGTGLAGLLLVSHRRRGRR